MAQTRDFYLREENDPAFRPSQLEVYDDLESTIQQVKMTLFTRKGEVLGEPDFGINIEKYLFEFSISPFSLSNEAESQINKYVSETRKRKITTRPASYNDDRSNREIFVLLIDIPELKKPLSVFYD
jgi:phage baseplate assembly protein W